MSASKSYLIDAAGCRLGRLASVVAKLLLQGNSVKIYNAEKAIITGNKRAVLSHYLMLRGRRQLKSHKTVSVWYPTRPDTILRYAIVRMLPRRKPRGIAAARRLTVVRGPLEKVDGERLELKDVRLEKPVSRSLRVIRFITLEELSRELRGGRP
ncbi:MAG: uL13 family ribosomal protein [Nitrososphaerota archaeon]